eukprot:8002134-Pyramimonas_sp.AAC.1
MPTASELQSLKVYQLIVLVHVPQNSGRESPSPDTSFRPKGSAPHTIHSPSVPSSGTVVPGKTRVPGLRQGPTSPPPEA